MRDEQRMAGTARDLGETDRRAGLSHSHGCAALSDSGAPKSLVIEVFPNLYVGNAADYELAVRGQVGWCVVHAYKEPYHRQALGYSGSGAPKDHPEYLVARRGEHLILNFIDAPDPRYIPRELIDAALEFIHECLAEGSRVLVHCNQGESRAPTLALLYLVKYTIELPGDMRGAIDEFRRRYPPYNPAGGVRGFTVANWTAYAG
jgi:hypothetical protein